MAGSMPEDMISSTASAALAADDRLFSGPRRRACRSPNPPYRNPDGRHADADLYSGEIGRTELQNDAFDSVMPAVAAVSFDSELARGILTSSNTTRIRSVGSCKTSMRAKSRRAEIHVCLRLDKQDFSSPQHAGSDKRFIFDFVYFYFFDAQSASEAMNPALCRVCSYFGPGLPRKATSHSGEPLFRIWLNTVASPV
jgi:hypothetical protein